MGAFVITSVQWKKERFKHNFKENITAPTRDGEYGRVEYLQMLRTAIMDFSVIKPQFSRRLSRFFSRPALG